jgi:hypothetical protein
VKARVRSIDRARERTSPSTSPVGAIPPDVRAELVERFARLLLEDLERFPSLPCDDAAPEEASRSA